MSASHQSIPGSYGEDAARQLCHDPVPCRTFADAVRMAEDGKTDIALLPIQRTRRKAASARPAACCSTPACLWSAKHTATSGTA